MTSTDGFTVAINTIGNIFVGTKKGVFRSDDNGENWTQINSGLTNLYDHSISIDSNNYLFAGTEDGFNTNSCPLLVNKIS